VDFRKGDRSYEPITIKGTVVERVTCYDYLGTTVSSDLTWSTNIQRQRSKAMKRMYHLRKMKEFKVCVKLQTLFYHSVIESVLVFGVVVWGGALTDQDKKCIKRVRKCAQRITGVSLPGWEPVYKDRVRQMARKVLGDHDHPLHQYLEYLPSGRRLRQPPARTQRFRDTLIPNGVAMINSGKVTL